MSVDDTPSDPAIFWPDRMRRLIVRLAEELGYCPYCSRQVAHIRMPKSNGLNMFDFEGTDHLATCLKLKPNRRAKDSIL